MPRTLSAAAIAEKDKRTGAEPVELLEVQFPGALGTKWYSQDAVTIPAGAGHGQIVAEPKLYDVGAITQRFEQQRAAGFGTTTFQLIDERLAFKALAEHKPTVQDSRVNLWLWFRGTTWATDRVLIMSGVVSAPISYDTSTGRWSITVTDLSTHYDADITTQVERSKFASATRTGDEGKVFPIVYGTNVRRVPAVLVCKPGESTLAERLLSTDSVAKIKDSADKAGFPIDTAFLVRIGNEQADAIIDSSDLFAITLTSRQMVFAQGLVQERASTEPEFFVLKEDFPDWNGDPDDTTSPPNKSGDSFSVWDPDTLSWKSTTISGWAHVTAKPFFIRLSLTNNFWPVPGAHWKHFVTGSRDWEVGTPVAEVAGWLYIANLLPSKAINDVEGVADVVAAGFGRSASDVFFSFREDDGNIFTNGTFAIELNDDQFLPALGHNVTTIKFADAPSVTHAHVRDNRIWVTLDGIEDIGDSTGEIIDNPADVILDILTNPHLGKVAANDIDDSSFTTVRDLLWQKCRFAITEQKQLVDVVADIAFQVGCILFWDQGKAVLRKLTNDPSAGLPDYTADLDNARSFVLAEPDWRSLTSHLSAVWRPDAATDVSEGEGRAEQRVIRTAGEIVDVYGKKNSRDVQAWAFQDRDYVRDLVEFQIVRMSQWRRRVTFESFLTALQLQPADLALLKLQLATGEFVFENRQGEVVEVQYQPGNARDRRMPSILVTVEFVQFDFHVDVIDEVDRSDCFGSIYFQ